MKLKRFVGLVGFVLFRRDEFLISGQNDVFLIEDNEPTSYEEYFNNLESNKWLIVMKLEMNSMYENQVCTLADPLEGIKPIGCKWVFKKKIDMEGKVRLLATKLGLWLKGIVKNKELTMMRLLAM